MPWRSGYDRDSRSHVCGDYCRWGNLPSSSRRTVRWVLRWETLPSNNDAPRSKYPPPGAIEAIELGMKP